MDDLKENQRIRIVLPEYGLKAQDGTLFYHTNQGRLCLQHLERLEEHGVIMRRGRFSREEDDLIKANWAAYAKEWKLDKNLAWEFAGGLNKIHPHEKTKARLIFAARTKFVPAMCEGFENRTGRQVFYRMREIFHPTVACVTTQRRGVTVVKPWTQDEQQELEKLHLKNYRVRDIGILMNRNYRLLERKVEIIKLAKETGSYHTYRDWDVSSRKYLYDFVGKQLRKGKLLDELIDKYFINEYALCAAHLANLPAEEIDKLDWVKVMRHFHKPLIEVKMQWQREQKRLKEALIACGGDFALALERCVPQCRYLTTVEFLQCLKILKEQKAKSVYDVDNVIFQKRLEEEHLTGFYTRGYTEATFIKEKVSSFYSYGIRLVGESVSGFLYSDWLNVVINYTKILIKSELPFKKFQTLVRKVINRKCSKLSADSTDRLRREKKRKAREFSGSTVDRLEASKVAENCQIRDHKKKFLIDAFQKLKNFS